MQVDIGIYKGLLKRDMHLVPNLITFKSIMVILVKFDPSTCAASRINIISGTQDKNIIHFFYTRVGLKSS